jgi:hypothetical protein
LIFSSSFGLMTHGLSPRVSEVHSQDIILPKFEG